jgi:hypothetical protein
VLHRLSIELRAEAIEAIAERAAELLATRQSRWLYGDKAAAEYLGWPVGRVTNYGRPARTSTSWFTTTLL